MSFVTTAREALAAAAVHEGSPATRSTSSGSYAMTEAANAAAAG
ncbi:PE family protein [Mycobacterium tuberculosis variant bovis]|nr:PE family protein [Mycobacterium tuberculosis variant bovis]